MKKKNYIIICTISIIIITAISIGVGASGILNPYERKITLGYKMITQEKYEEAILAFNKAIEIDEKSYKAYIGLADTYVARCDESTVEDSNNALKRGYEKSQSPDIVQGYIDAAQKLYDKDKKEWAVKLLRKGYKVTKNDLIRDKRKEWDFFSEENEQANNGANRRMVVQQGDWIYYLEKVNDKSAPRGFYNIFKENKSGANKQRLSKEPVVNFGVSREWIYYNIENKQGIYRIKTDGSNMQKISDDYVGSLTVIDDCIYYCSFRFNPDIGYEAEKITKMKTDGTEKSYISDYKASNMNVQDGMIYFSNASNRDKLYSISIDGTGGRKISDDSVECINVIGDWIYYIKYNSYADVNITGDLCKIKNDGSNRTIIDDNCRCLNVTQNRIYYAKDSSNISTLYGMDIDGGNVTKYIDSKFIYDIDVVNGFIYNMYSKGDTDAINKISINNKSIQDSNAELKYKTYTNARFGFSIDYPTNLIAGREPDNLDGLQFKSQDGKVILTASGIHNVLNYTAESLYNQKLSYLKVKPSYTNLQKNSYAISWEEDGVIHYEYNEIGGDNNNLIEGFNIEYPYNQNNIYSSVIEKIYKSFKPFKIVQLE